MRHPALLVLGTCDSLAGTLLTKAYTDSTKCTDYGAFIYYYFLDRWNETGTDYRVWQNWTIGLWLWVP